MPLNDKNARKELKPMSGDSAEGRPVERGAETHAANEDFAALVSRSDGAGGREDGWDPYEVWRTRVRAPSKAARARTERARDPEG